MNDEPRKRLIDAMVLAASSPMFVKAKPGEFAKSAIEQCELKVHVLRKLDAMMRGKIRSGRYARAADMFAEFFDGRENKRAAAEQVREKRAMHRAVIERHVLRIHSNLVRSRECDPRKFTTVIEQRLPDDCKVGRRYIDAILKKNGRR